MARCWFHRWGSDEWLGGIAYPVIRNVCTKCGKERIWGVGP